MSHEDKLRAAYKSWHDTKGADKQKWFDLMADNIVFRSLAGGAEGMEFTKTCESKEEVQRYFSGLTDGWEMLYYTPEKYICDGDSVAVRGTTGWKNKTTGKEVHTPKADFFEFQNGKIIEFYEFYDTAKAFEGAS
jgi:ketosteroid isomerase-like protein